MNPQAALSVRPITGAGIPGSMYPRTDMIGCLEMWHSYHSGGAMISRCGSFESIGLSTCRVFTVDNPAIRAESIGRIVLANPLEEGRIDRFGRPSFAVVSALGAGVESMIG
ncbi:MAG: hypothetical protein U5K37_11530 [Natrialbaceae archaeon]|nr:hypothetical protein [Natrialbaceae archaeon]